MIKKAFSFILVGILAISTFSLVACGDDATKDDSTSKSIISKEDDKKDIAESKEKTVEDWINDPIISKQLEEQIPEDYEISAEGNTLIYTIKQDIAVEVDSIFIDALKAGMSAQEETFKVLGNSIRTEIGISEITILFKFINSDDSEIYTHTITCK